MRHQALFFQFQPLPGLPEDGSSAKAWLDSQCFVKLDELPGEGLRQLEQRPPRARQLHLWIRHEPGKLSISTKTMTMTLQLTMTYITFTGWLSYAGCYAASLSSAIASLIGAPRILQVVNNTQQFLGAPIGIFINIGCRLWGRMGSTLALVGLKKVATPTTTQSEVGALPHSLSRIEKRKNSKKISNLERRQEIWISFRQFWEEKVKMFSCYSRLLPVFCRCDGLCDDCQPQCDRNCRLQLLPRKVARCSSSAMKIWNPTS